MTAEEVVAREPDLIIGSWCGKKFRPERVAARPGFDRIPAVQRRDMYEIKSSLILQPGSAALTDGFTELRRIIERRAIAKEGDEVSLEGAIIRETAHRRRLYDPVLT